jgi:hypothetical protein
VDVEVLVPFRSNGCPHRKKAWAWVRRRYKDRGLTVTTAAADSGPWIKASAVMPALRFSTAEVAVIADADVWTDGLERGLHALTCGMAEWVVPHRRVLRLSRASTEQLLDTGRPGRELARRDYVGKLGGGIVIARREALLQAPMDRRFAGWGHEDDSWGAALETLLGPPWRGDADLLHLWHPPAPKLSRNVGSVESHDLYRRYLEAARYGPDQMRELLKGAL